METETVNLEVLINEILMMPTNTYEKDELRKKTYIELLDIRDELYDVGVFG